MLWIANPEYAGSSPVRTSNFLKGSSMSYIRNHRIFIIEYVSKSPSMGLEIFKKVRIVAPNEEIAKAWVRAKGNVIKIVSCQANKLDAFIQEKIW